MVEHESAGGLTSKGRGHHAQGASLGAILLVLFASTLAAAQSDAETAGAGVEIHPRVRQSSVRHRHRRIAPPSRTGPSPDRAHGRWRRDASQLQPPSAALESQPSDDESSDVAGYRKDGSEQLESEGELSTPFGMQLCEAHCTLKSGEEADGLLITAVEKNSPAAAVGLHAYTHGVHDAFTGVAKVGAVVLFLMVPGGQLAILLMPAIDSMHVGESYDMIIGVDGWRVTKFLDFQDRMSDLQPGEVIYLSVVRNGKRVQVTMPVPANAVQATN